MASSARSAQLHASLAGVRARVATAAAAAALAAPAAAPPLLVAVSKYKPPTDIGALHAAGQRHFGENYAQELADKAAVLPPDIRWHFIGHLQSNKAKLLGAIPNLHAVHSLTTPKLASALNVARRALARRALPHPTEHLRVLLQVNTSAEPAKAGLAPLDPADPAAAAADLVALARHVIVSCPHLHLAGLMTIGALAHSRAAADTDDNPDFHALRTTRAVLERILALEFPPERWGAAPGALALSMGMSADFEAAIYAGSAIVRVGASIFGERPQRPEIDT